MFLPKLCGWHQIRSVRHVFCLLEGWSEHKTVGRAMLAEQWQSCFLREKFQFAGLPGFVPCLHLLGGMAQLSLERVRGFLVRTAHSLVRVLTGGANVRRILRLNWWSLWDCVGGTGDPAWQLCKAPAEAKALLFPFVANKIIARLRSMGLFGAALILVLEIYLWIWLLKSGRAAEVHGNQKDLASLWKH